MFQKIYLAVVALITMMTMLSASPTVHSQGPTPDGDTAQDYLERGIHFANTVFDTEAAITNLSKAVELDPTLTTAYVERGRIYHDLDAFDLARDDFSRALELDPNSEEALLGRANYHIAIARWENITQAREDINRVLELNPESVEAMVAEGNLLAAQGLLDEAFEQFTAVIDRAPDHLVARSRRLGIASQLTNTPPRYVNELEVLLEMAAGTPFYYPWQSFDNYRRRDFTDAMAPCHDGLEHFPNHAPMLEFCAGQASIIESDPAVALSYIDRAIELAPMSPRFRVQRGNQLRQNGKRTGAIAEFEAALSLQPGYVPATNQLLQMFLYSPLNRDCEQAGVYVVLAQQTFPENTRYESQIATLYYDYTTACVETEEPVFYDVDHPAFVAGTTVVMPGTVMFQLGSEPGVLYGGPLCTSGSVATVLRSVAASEAGAVWVELECDTGTGWVPETFLE